MVRREIFIGAAALIAFVVGLGFIMLQRFGVDIHIHDTYWVVPIRKIAFWVVIALAAVSLLIAVYKFVRPSS